MRFKRISFVVTLIVVMMLNTMVVCAETRERNKRHSPCSGVFLCLRAGLNGKKATGYYRIYGESEAEGCTIVYSTYNSGEIYNKTVSKVKKGECSDSFSKSYISKKKAKNEGTVIGRIYYYDGSCLLQVAADWSE